MCVVGEHTSLTLVGPSIPPATRTSSSSCAAGIILRPRRRPGVTPQPAPAPHSDAIIDLYKHQVKVAEEARVKAEDALREERQRSDARIDAMRKEHQAHLEALLLRCAANSTPSARSTAWPTAIGSRRRPTWTTGSSR